MQGFKSFNKRVSIPFLKGFNIVCGPNGVGKSNVVDAICFVLGRSSAKSLRADRLHELIFHGGDGKQPASQASVSLYLDNSEKTFSFEDEEVSVTRKVNKKGVCIYKVNGKTTTREKLLEVLSSARIYPDGHNIILQGDVTQILEMNPIERRFIIDEISGIADYNEKKNRASQDLETVDQKLKEAEIVITERYDIFKKLEDERNAALRYQSLQKQLLILKASLAHKKFVEFKETDKTLEEEIKKKETENESLQKEIEEIEKELEEREKAITGLANKLVSMSRRVEVEREISRIRSSILINKDKIDSDKREIERLNSLIEKLEAIENRRFEDIGEMPRAVRAILKQNLKGVVGTVANLIKVPERYQTAIEVAAGPHLHDVVVDDDKTASFCINYLKEERIGRATFLPLNKIKPRAIDRSLLSKSNVIGLASELIKYDNEFDSALKFVFGSTVIVKDLESARVIGIGKVRMVTLTGDLIELSGAMIGGYYIRTHPQSITSSAKDEVESYRKTRKSLEEEIETLTGEMEKLEKELKKHSEDESTKEFVGLEKVKIDTEKKLDSLRRRRKHAYDRRLFLQSDLNKLRIQKAKLEAELENLTIEVQEYGKVRYLDKEVKDLEGAVKESSVELQNIGAVNFKAIEQYENFRKDFDEYKKKYEKILEEKKAVLEMIEKIEEKRREIFNKCLQEVSQHFNEVFNKMTKGTASLGLENPMDLESGLAIQVNPAGKMLLNIDSLSGGEKTLTALAFLFAIQKYRPAPFYILDEVDAALDKENSRRVAELIKELSKNEQFLMITHNDETIKFGDRVYGVTMEAGESKILGLEMPG
jgi:chromosome segregation protein